MAYSQEEMRENVCRIRETMALAARRAGRAPGDIALCAASKTQPPEVVELASALDIDLFGENRVQELVQKADAGAYGGKPVHLIGHLQTNKVRQTVGRAALIHSVASTHLMEAINAEARKRGLVQDILLEINIGGEESKSGAGDGEVWKLLDAAETFSFIRVRGLMAIPPPSQAPGGNRPFFERMSQLFIDIRSKKYDNANMDYLSMGMSGDYEDAILEGANIIRIGTAIFGKRDYR